MEQSIERLIRCLANLEGKEDEPTTLAIAQDIASGLGAHDREFRDFHYQLLDLIDEGDQGTLDNEQRELDDHTDLIDDANLRVKKGDSHLLSTMSTHQRVRPLLESSRS